MHAAKALSTFHVLRLLAAVVVLRVTASVVWGYRAYLPPDFCSTFLLGREPYFFGLYGAAFYAHLLAGPATLLLGTLLVSDAFRQRWPRAHRRLGKVQVALVLLLLVPSGLWMALYADGGLIAASGFAALALATGTSAVLGTQAALRRQFAVHRVWMWRCYLMLCSAVTLRLIGGLVAITGIGGNFGVDGSYPVAAWASWLVPLAIFEFGRRLRQRPGYSQSASAASSSPAIVVSARR